MSLTNNIDYVVAHQVKGLFQKGSFIGTKQYLIYVPAVDKEFTSSSIRTTTTYSVDGDTIEAAIDTLLTTKDTSMAQIIK